MNIPIITNHPRLSILIYFILTDTNNRIIENHPRFFITEIIIQKSHLMLLRYVYSPMLLYIRRYTCTHSCTKASQEIPSYEFHYMLYIHLSSTSKHILSYHSQKLHIFLKTWKCHVTLLKTQDGDVPKTRNTLVNYLHFPLTHITVQVL